MELITNVELLDRYSADGLIRVLDAYMTRGLRRRRITPPLVEIQANGCWKWLYCGHPDGYGQILINGKHDYIHRHIFKEFGGTIPKDFTVDHLCRNRWCCNPKHLEPVTRKENVMRGEGLYAKYSRMTHCKRGHEYTPENTKVISTKRIRHGRVCKACTKENYRKYYKPVGAGRNSSV